MRIPECPHCHVPITDVKTVTPDELPEIGSLFLCGTCASLSTFEDLHVLTLLTPREIRKLHPDELRDVQFAVRNIIAAGKAKQNEEQARALALLGKTFSLS